MIPRRRLAQVALYEDLCPLCDREILQLEHMVLQTRFVRLDSGDVAQRRRAAWAHADCVEQVDVELAGELRLEAPAAAARSSRDPVDDELQLPFDEPDD